MKHHLTIRLDRVFQEKRHGNDISKQPMFTWLRDNANGDWDWEHMKDGRRCLFSFQEHGDYLRFKNEWWIKNG